MKNAVKRTLFVALAMVMTAVAGYNIRPVASEAKSVEAEAVPEKDVKPEEEASEAGGSAAEEAVSVSEETSSSSEEADASPEEVTSDSAEPAPVEDADTPEEPEAVPAEPAVTNPDYNITSENLTLYVQADTEVRTLPEDGHGSAVMAYTAGTTVQAVGVCAETGWYETNDGYVSNSAVTPVSYEWHVTGSTQADIDANQFICFTDWDSDYFAADIVSEYGPQIASLQPGMIVDVDGRFAEIDGEIHDNYNWSSYEEIRSQTGYGTPCFQTCEPPYGGPIVVKYGHWL